MGCRKPLFSESGRNREKDGGTRSPQRQQLDTRNDATEGQNSLLNEWLSVLNDDPQSVGGQSRITSVPSCTEEWDAASPGYRTPTRRASEKGIGVQVEITPITKGVASTGVCASTLCLFSPMATVTAAQAQVSPIEEQLHTHKETMDNALVPTAGMSFKGEDEAEKFYRRYAQLAGFDINLGNKKTYSRVMRCTSAGKGEFYKKNEDLRVRNNTSKKKGCKARVKFKRVYDSEGKEQDMVIEWANLFHNHMLTPKHTETKHMRGHKSKEPALFEIVDELQAADAPNQCIKNVLINLHGGPENVPITDRDIENRKAANMRAEHADDINKLIEFFKSCEEQNPQFHWNTKLDSEGVIHSLFWSHASMQGDYADFGDALSFDTTHKTNVYEKPLAMFVGSNNHLQNTVFGCALLGDETEETFKWVFRAFKKCMGKNRTRCILTDQDQAMAAAIVKELPGIIHKICRWHVENKHRPLLNNLFALHAERNLKEKFYSLLNHPLTPLEFEAAWQEMLDEFELHEDSTLDSLYRQRKLFIPVYFKDQYCGRMASTQRSESANFVMKKCFVNKRTALHRFAKKVLHFIHTRKMKEGEKNYKGTSKTITKGKWRFEMQASRIYTRAVFQNFEKKMVDCTAYNVEEDHQEGKDCYLVTHTNMSSKISWGQHHFKVHANKEGGDFRCECREFEHTGLLCVHLLRAFIHIQVDKIPEQYILKRYTKYANQELEFSTHDKLPDGEDGVIQTCRMKRLSSKAMAVVRSGVMSEAAAQNTEVGLDRILRENKNFPSDIRTTASNDQRQSTDAGLSSCSESEDKQDEDQWNEMNAGETDHVDAGGGDVMGVMRTSKAQGKAINKGKGQLNASGYGAQENGADDSMISRRPPPRAKPKGRKMTEIEKKQLTLGAKGEKKGTRKCSICGFFATHNARTCPQLPENRERLKAMQNKQRGRPLGAKNKSSAMREEDVQEDNEMGPATRKKGMTSTMYSEWGSDSISGDDMDSDI